MCALFADYLYFLVNINDVVLLYSAGHQDFPKLVFCHNLSMLMKFGWVEHEVIVVKQTETEAIPMRKLLVMM